MNLINSNAVARVGRYFSTSCSTSASEQIKEITIENLTLVNGDIIGINFSNENSYGDCTLITPTYPTLKLNSGSALPICDSHGHTVGKGCWNSGDYIELRYCGNKFVIINSNIRQTENGSNGYIIFSNGKLKKSPRYYSVKSGTKITLTDIDDFELVTIGFNWSNEFAIKDLKTFTVDKFKSLNAIRCYDVTNISFYVDIRYYSQGYIATSGSGSDYIYAYVLLH